MFLFGERGSDFLVVLVVFLMLWALLSVHFLSLAVTKMDPPMKRGGDYLVHHLAEVAKVHS